MRLDIFNGYIAYITLFIVLILISKEIVLTYKHYYIIISAAANLYFVHISDGSSPKKTSPGRARALKVDLEPGPSLSPSEKVKPKP